jgi:hypothetical protein
MVFLLIFASYGSGSITLIFSKYSIIGFELGWFLTIGKVFSKAGMVSHSNAGFSHADGIGYLSVDLCWQLLQGNMI